ncbi:hypothetical protein F4678DRAFT_195261 [Xylaria arbuscula]|nr:hypothetical protein F4678DRAFT_195261 [Xylaria arbuscula]
MQLQFLYIFALAGFGAATTTCIPTSEIPPTRTTLCVDYSLPCGTPPTATVWYGGCHDITETTTYTPPPCPTGGDSMVSCTSTGTICDDRFKTCATTTLSYGACHDACVTLTYSEPPCPTPTESSSSSASDSSSSCTYTYTLCEDHIETCGSPTPTAFLTYGGCHPACEHPTYTPPPCPTTTS